MRSKPIHEIKKIIAEDALEEKMLEQLKSDPRKGVQRLIAIYEKKQAEKAIRTERFQKMQAFDHQFRTDEKLLLAGVDEAGRGPLAGPVVAAAVILPENFSVIDINDSKQLSETERKQLFEMIKEQAISYSISIVHNDEIDQLNILNATKKAMTNALNTLPKQPDFALIDAVQLGHMNFPCKDIIKGDEKSISIAAASILAKVARDEMMDDIDEQYPDYDFKHHKGYGTKKHIEALQKYGPTPYHRKSFTPVQEVLLKREGLV